MSKLDDVSKPLRAQNMAKNKYNSVEYNATHPDALSDGDELGKGEDNGSIGGKTDIAHRAFLTNRGKGVYAGGKEYNQSNY